MIKAWINKAFIFLLNFIRRKDAPVIKRKWEIRTKYEILQVLAVADGGVNNKLDFKVPEHFIEVGGIHFSAVSSGATLTARAGLAAKNFVMGMISLYANNKSNHVLHQPVQVKPHSLKTRKYQFMDLKTPLKGGSRIQGYYMDGGASATVYPYTLNIILKGKAKVYYEELSK